MDVREKLVELLDEAEEWADHKCDELDCETCYAGKMKGNCVQKLMVDRLIDHGVTVQEWISVKDRLPEEHDSIWAKLYGAKSWQPGLFRKCSYDVLACVEKKDGSRRVISMRTYDGKWDHNKLNEETVICWQPMPQPLKGE